MLASLARWSPALVNSSDEEFFLDLSADGRVLFQRHVGARQFDLYSVKVDGSDLRPLANGADSEVVGVVGANGRVVFTRIAAGRFDLYSVRTDGSGLIALAPSDADEFVPFATTGGRIVFRRRVAADRSDLFIVNDDGTSWPLRRRLKMTTPSGVASRKNSSSDALQFIADGHAYFLRGTGDVRELHRVRTDATTAEESLARRVVDVRSPASVAAGRMVICLRTDESGTVRRLDRDFSDAARHPQRGRHGLLFGLSPVYAMAVPMTPQPTTRADGGWRVPRDWRPGGGTVRTPAARLRGQVASCSLRCPQWR